jgi:hypothetical protein
LASLLYYLREQLSAQGARGHLGVDKDRGFAAWVEENLDIPAVLLTAGANGLPNHHALGRSAHKKT